MAEQRTGDRAAAPPLPETVTLPLLTLISRQALDEDYVRAAERRERSPSAPSAMTKSHRRRYLSVVAIVVFGLLASTAAVQQSKDAVVDDAGRATLTSRILQERERVSQLQDRVVDLREANALSTSNLAQTVDDAEVATNQVRRLRIRTGLVSVVGPGVRVTLTSADDAVDGEVVRDSDVALLVNGLWSAGAEAVSINGQRLTPLSAIRNRNVAIEVNSVGVAPPYVVSAIGDRRTLQADFFDTSSGLAFADLARNFGFTYDFNDQAEVSLPSGPARYLRLTKAQPVPDTADTNRGETG